MKRRKGIEMEAAAQGPLFGMQRKGGFGSFYLTPCRKINVG